MKLLALKALCVAAPALLAIAPMLVPLYFTLTPVPPGMEGVQCTTSASIVCCYRAVEPCYVAGSVACRGASNMLWLLRSCVCPFPKLGLISVCAWSPKGGELLLDEQEVSASVAAGSCSVRCDPSKVTYLLEEAVDAECLAASGSM